MAFSKPDIFYRMGNTDILPLISKSKLECTLEKVLNFDKLKIGLLWERLFWKIFFVRLFGFKMFSELFESLAISKFPAHELINFLPYLESTVLSKLMGYYWVLGLSSII